MTTNRSTKPAWYEEVDWLIAGICAGVLTLFLLWSQLAGDNMGEIMTKALAFFTKKLGSTYLIVSFITLVFCIFLACSKYGDIKIGADDEKPRYSFFVWFSMLFAACYGSGLVYWGACEPLTFISQTPFGIEPGSERAAEVALSYAFFHWGFTPWALTALPGIAFGYFIYRKNMAPRYSVFLQPLLKDKYGGYLCRFVDALLVVSAIGALACNIGLGTKQFVFGLNTVLGIPNNTFVLISFCILTVVVFTFSCISGVDKGIKFLSTANVYLALGIVVVVLVIGPTFFTFDLSTQAFGDLLHNFFRMSFYTDPIGQNGFAQGWTIFYLAWWFACATQIGLFIATISRGRTIRQMIIGILLFAPLGTFAWIGTMGSTAIYQQFVGGIDLVAVLKELGNDGALWAFLETLPFSKILGVAHLILIFIFVVTTCDSAIFVWSQCTMHQKFTNIEPSKVVRLAYCAGVTIIVLILMVRGVGVTGFQLSPVIVSFPVVVIFIVMMYAIMKAMNTDSLINK